MAELHQNMHPPGPTGLTVDEQLEDVPLDSPAWRSFSYLFEKEKRDADKGNCFAMQIVHPNDQSVPTLRRGCFKAGSTDPLLAHPAREGLYRLFTPSEHARFKGIPACLIAGMSATQAHQGLGQSIAYPVVTAIFELLGRSLATFSKQGLMQYQMTQTSQSYQQTATG